MIALFIADTDNGVYAVANILGHLTVRYTLDVVRWFWFFDNQHFTGDLPYGYHRPCQFEDILLRRYHARREDHDDVFSHTGDGWVDHRLHCAKESSWLSLRLACM